MKRFPVVVMLVVGLAGCGKTNLSSDNIGADGKCTVAGFRPFGTSFPSLTSSQKEAAIQAALTKAEAYYSFIFLISSPDRPTVLPGHPFMAQAKEGLDSGKCKAHRDSMFPKKGETKTEISFRGDACPVEAYLILDERQGGFEGYTKSKYHRLSQFNDKSLATTDLQGMKFDGETEGDNIVGTNESRTSICESLSGTLESKSLGRVPLYASEEARHVIPDDLSMESYLKNSESHRKLRRGFKLDGYVAEFEVRYDKVGESSKYSFTLNGEPLTASELKALGKSDSEVMKTLSAN